MIPAAIVVSFPVSTPSLYNMRGGGGGGGELGVETGNEAIATTHSCYDLAGFLACTVSY